MLVCPVVVWTAAWLPQSLTVHVLLRIGGQWGYLLAAALGYGLVCPAVCFSSALAGVLRFLVALV